MAERKSITTFDSIMRELHARRFSPIYILMGDEAYFIDRISDYIAENVLKQEEKDFNQTIVFGSDVTAKQVVDMACRYPMMSEYQVVIVKEAQNIKNIDALEVYLRNPMKTTVLVWCYKNGVIDRRKKSVAAVMSLAESVGVVFESKKMRDRDLNAFIENYLKARNVSIDVKSVQMIADHIGSDLNRLTSELNKVLISLSDNEKKITPEIVESRIGVSKDFNAFELRSAIINRNVFKANQIIKYFDNNPKAGSLYSFLPMLFKYFENLMISYYAPDKNNENALAKFLEIGSGWAARDYAAGMRNYTARKTMQIIYKIREIDAKSKGLDNPNTGAGELMKELIFFILH